MQPGARLWRVPLLALAWTSTGCESGVVDGAGGSGAGSGGGGGVGGDAGSVAATTASSGATTAVGPSTSGPGPGPVSASSGIACANDLLASSQLNACANQNCCDEMDECAADPSSCTIEERCCEPFDACTNRGASQEALEDCWSCFQAGGGPLCDAALACERENCDSTICGSGIAVSDQDQSDCLEEQCCEAFTFCSGGDPNDEEAIQTCIDCFIAEGGPLCDDAIACADEFCRGI